MHLNARHKNTILYTVVDNFYILTKKTPNCQAFQQIIYDDLAPKYTLLIKNFK